MADKKRDYLKQEFRDGERPSGTDFADLIDSYLNKIDDGLTVDGAGNLQLSAGMALGDTSSATRPGTLRFHDGAVQFFNGSNWVAVASGDTGAFQPFPGSTAVTFAGGNVGVGTFATAPAYRLHVNLAAAEGTANQVRFGNAVCWTGYGGSSGYACFSHYSHATNNNFAVRQGPNGNVHINAVSGQVISFRHNSDTIRMGVSSSGNVIIGGDSDLGAAGSAKLQVSGEAYKSMGTSAWSVTSDARVKENIRELELGLNHLVQVRPVRFRYNGKAGTTAGIEGVGILGQELEKVFPEMIEHVRTPLAAELDDDDMLVYNASSLTYVLVNAVKELAAKVEKLELALAQARRDGTAPELKVS